MPTTGAASAALAMAGDMFGRMMLTAKTAAAVCSVLISGRKRRILRLPERASCASSI